MKVATYNVRVDTDYDREWQWSFRKPYVLDLIAYHDWDILAVQEVRPNQVSDLKQLAGYDVRCVERDGDGTGEGLALLYKKNRFEVVKSQFFWLSQTPNQPSKHPDAGYLRVALSVLFKDKQTQQAFLVINTHLDSDSEAARVSGMKVINQLLKSAIADYPTIILGDFNAEPEEAVHKLLTNDFLNAKEDALLGHYGPKGSYQNFEYTRKWQDLEEIDYIYVKGGKVLKTGMLTDSCDQRYPSDHFPLEAELYLEEG